MTEGPLDQGRREAGRDDPFVEDTGAPTRPTRRHDPARQVLDLPRRRASFQQGCLAWDTCTVATPIRHTSPMQTSASAIPPMVKFLPKAPYGITGRADPARQPS